MNAVGLYVHIPFCVKKCLYCDFCSWPGQEALFEAYVDAVLDEARSKRTERPVATFFIGGGTPSCLPAPLMRRLLRGLREIFSFDPEAECTCEMNPGTVTEEFLSVLRENGINRVSLGVQALQDRLLRSLGRVHTAEAALDSLALVLKSGFDRVNCDVMCELPGQNAEDLRFTLETLTGSGCTHLSCYSLIPEEHTVLGDGILRGEILQPPEEELEKMDRVRESVLAERGFCRYEISNYCLPGQECRHNRDCWRRKEYLGLGCAAAGFIGEERSVNCRDLKGYLRGEPPCVTRITPEEARFESVMLGLRMTEGVELSAFARMHGMTLEEAFGEKLLIPVRQGLAVYENGFYRLTDRGLDLQSSVLLSLMDG